MVFHILDYENEKIYLKLITRGRMFINYGFIIEGICVQNVAIL